MPWVALSFIGSVVVLTVPFVIVARVLASDEVGITKWRWSRYLLSATTVFLGFFWAIIISYSAFTCFPPPPTSGKMSPSAEEKRSNNGTDSTDQSPSLKITRPKAQGKASNHRERLSQSTMQAMHDLGGGTSYRIEISPQLLEDKMDCINKLKKFSVFQGIILIVIALVFVGALYLSLLARKKIDEQQDKNKSWGEIIETIQNDLTIIKHLLQKERQQTTGYPGGENTPENIERSG